MLKLAVAPPCCAQVIQAWAKTGTGSSAVTLSSSVIITVERLAAVESQGGVLSEVLGLQSEVT